MVEKICDYMCFMTLNSELGRTDLILKTSSQKISNILLMNAARWKQTYLILGHLWVLSVIPMKMKMIIGKKKKGWEKELKMIFLHEYPLCSRWERDSCLGLPHKIYFSGVWTAANPYAESLGSMWSIALTFAFSTGTGSWDQRCWGVCMREEGKNLVAILGPICQLSMQSAASCSVWVVVPHQVTLVRKISCPRDFLIAKAAWSIPRNMSHCKELMNHLKHSHIKWCHWKTTS